MTRVAALSPSPRGRLEAGRGVIGFLIALVLVILVGMSLRAFYRVKHAADVMDGFTYELIQRADRSKMSADDVKEALIKKGSELGLTLPKAAEISVMNDQNGWKVDFEFQDTVFLPGYSFPWNTKINKSWTRF